jgi:transposase
MPTSMGTRATVLALRSTGKTTAEVAGLLELSDRTVNDIYARAIKRGFDPVKRPIQIDDVFIADAPRSGRPKKQSPELQEKVLAKVRHDRFGREKTCADIAGEISLEGLNISATTIWRILRSASLKKTKPTRKPGLTQKMKNERLKWCLQHQHWTLEDFKNVIWTDETSVVLLHRRGGYRVWRSKDEALVRSCIRERWKGSSEFMFWGSFSYDRKGPCYCWRPETAQEKREADIKIARLNEELEPIMKQQWELENGVRRLNLRQLPGPKPTWRWHQQTGKLSRSKSKGGIDWWRYQSKILIPKLLPFAKECMLERPNTIVQEDKAPAHYHYFQQRVFDMYEVQRLLWCGNSPDLNAIEPTWPWLKRYTTKKGAPKNRADAIKAWEKGWEELPQEAIQRWIERIPYHIQQIIQLEGGNEYKEGREKTV